MDLDDFLRLASTLEGTRLETRVRRAGFRVAALPAGLEVTPESTGRSRLVQRGRIALFLDEYRRSGSVHAGHYQDLTFDASYLLAIVSLSKAPKGAEG